PPSDRAATPSPRRPPLRPPPRPSRPRWSTRLLLPRRAPPLSRSPSTPPLRRRRAPPSASPGRHRRRASPVGSAMVRPLPRRLFRGLLPVTVALCLGGAAPAQAAGLAPTANDDAYAT